VDDFFAPRCRTKSRPTCQDDEKCTEQPEFATCQVYDVKTEHTQKVCEKSDVTQKVNDFFAPRCGSRSKPPCKDEEKHSEEHEVAVCEVSEVRTENVRRSSRLSAQAAAAAIARAVQVKSCLVKYCRLSSSSYWSRVTFACCPIS